MRVFLALDLSEEQACGLGSLQKKLKKDFNGVKWVDASNMHVTLKFLGEIEEHQLDSLFTRVEKAVEKFDPFHMSLKGLGVFPNPNRPRIIWSGVNEGSDYIKLIWEEVEWQLQEEGFSLSQKTYTPHVTLGRIRRVSSKVPAKKWVNQYREFTLPATEIKYVTFYQSTLQPQGACYKALSMINF